MNKSYLFLADGFEETEALATVDMLRRAGIGVSTVSVNPTHEVTGAHGIKVYADAIISATDISGAEWLILPGGLPGASNLAGCAKLTEALVKQHLSGGKIAAICASPAVVLAPLGILDGRKATCYPGFEAQCEKAVMCSDAVVALDTLVTANGPGSTFKFALAIVRATLGDAAANQLASGMLLA